MTTALLKQEFVDAYNALATTQLVKIFIEKNTEPGAVFGDPSTNSYIEMAGGVKKYYTGLSHPSHIDFSWTEGLFLTACYSAGPGAQSDLYFEDGYSFSVKRPGPGGDKCFITAEEGEITILTPFPDLPWQFGDLEPVEPTNVVLVGGDVVGEVAVDPTVDEVLYDDDNDPETPSVALPAGSVLRNTTDGQKFLKKSVGGSKAYAAIPIEPKDGTQLDGVNWDWNPSASAAWAILQAK